MKNKFITLSVLIFFQVGCDVQHKPSSNIISKAALTETKPLLQERPGSFQMDSCYEYLWTGRITREYIQCIQPFAEEKNSEALRLLANLHVKGLGMPKNHQKAIGLLESSVELGNIEALFDLGELYASGSYFPKDNAKARFYFLEAANKNHARAMYALGLIYNDGAHPIKQDTQKAREYFEKSRQQGYIPAREMVEAIDKTIQNKKS